MKVTDIKHERMGASGRRALEHYRRMVASIGETIILIQEVDEAINATGDLWQ